jgi:hypothetical protein
MYGDEARLLKFSIEKTPTAFVESTPFLASVYYRGTTFTTDMPNIIDGDEDWIMQDEKRI